MSTLKPQKHYRLKSGKYVYRFDGATYEAELDGAALSSLMDRVFHIMLRGAWVTTSKLVKQVGSDAASVSARIRDLRKPQFGAYRVEARRHPDKERRVWQYRMKLDKLGKLGKPRFNKETRKRFHSKEYQRLGKYSKEDLILKVLKLERKVSNLQ